MVYHHLQPSFSGGEVSPNAAARADGSVFSSWLKTAKNFFIHPQGGASNRPGTLFVARAKYPDKAVRLVPFMAGDEEAYVLEAGDKYVRLHTSSGPVTDADGQPLEFAAPYGEYDVARLNYAQYNQTLYLAHPDHPPYRFSRTPEGVFTLEELTLTGGPFMTANTDETRRMRVVTQAGGAIATEGVSASVSFQPIIYPQYALRASFRGVGFYMDVQYGCNIQAMVNKFNSIYAPAGFWAENQGGVVTVTSPAATGGDCNGAEFLIEYLWDITDPPKDSVVYRLSGGSNAGTLIPDGNETRVLESDFDFFRPGHAGGLMSLSHEMESQHVSGSVGYDGASLSVPSGGDWRFKTSGTWSGTVALEKSTDGGLTWKNVKHFSRAANADNLSEFGNLDQTSQLYLVRLRAVGVSGEMGYEIWSDTFMQEAVVRLKTYVNARKMEVEIIQYPAQEDWSWRWAEGSFSQSAGFPACVFCHQDRLGFACTRREPQTLWFSKIGEYGDFGHFRALRDSDGFGVNLSGKSLNSIRSVAVSGKLFVFTSGSEWTVDADGAFSAYTLRAGKQGERGASRVPAVVAGGRVLFVQARGSVLRDFVYDYSTASYTGADLTLLSRHLFFNREIKEIACQQEPDELFWCVMSDGDLLSLTYQPQQGLCAWTRHQTAGQFISVCAVPARGYDEIWLAVRRANGVCVERLSARMPTKDSKDQLFLDAAVGQSSDVAFTRMEGLEHLEGETVSVLADGNAAEGLTVRDGAVELPMAARRAYAGLPYEAELCTLPAELTLADGTSRDRKRRAVGVTLSLLDSRGGWVGADGGKLDELVYVPQTEYSTAPPLQTGEYDKTLASSHGPLAGIVFRQKDPLPVTLLGIVVRTA